VKCPSLKCGLVFVVQHGCTGVTDVCPYCRVRLCTGCGSAWGPAHVGRSCAAAAEALRSSDDALTSTTTYMMEVRAMAMASICHHD